MVFRAQTICVIDLGSSTIRMIVAEPRSNAEGLKIHGLVAIESRGVRKGSVVDIQEAALALRRAREELERVVGFPVEKVLVNVSGLQAQALESHGVIAVSRADGEISRDDVQRVLAAAQAVSIGPNREILHIIPREFIVDGERGMKNVVGMSGVRLEVEALLLSIPSPNIRNLDRALREAGMQAKEFVLSPLALSQAILSKRQKELGVAALDIGSAISDLAVFEEGEIIHVASIPIGSAHITNDLAIGMRCSLELAEKAKIEYGSCVAENVSKKEMIELSLLDSEQKVIFPRRELTSIIEARLEEIFDLARKELIKIQRDALLPAGIVLSGGGAKLPGIVDLAKRKFRLPAQIAQSNFSENIPRELNDSAWACALGLVLWEADSFNASGQKKFFLKLPKIFVLPSFLEQIQLKAKNFFKLFLP